MFDFILHYNTGPHSEMVYEIPMTTWKPYEFNILYQEELKDVRKGDLIICSATAEVTTSYYYNVMICSYLVLTKNKDDVDGIIISPPYGGNVDKNEHHRPVYSSGSAYIESEDYKYVSFIIYAASTSARQEDLIVCEPDYGRLIISQYREKE